MTSIAFFSSDSEFCSRSLSLTLSLISLCLHLEKKKTGHGWDSICFGLMEFDYPLIHWLTLILIKLRITNSLLIGLFVMLIASYLNNSIDRWQQGVGSGGGRRSTCNWSWDSQCRVTRLFLTDQTGAELRQCIIYTLLKGCETIWHEKTYWDNGSVCLLKIGRVRNIRQAQTIDEHTSQQLQSFYCMHTENSGEEQFVQKTK